MFDAKVTHVTLIQYMQADQTAVKFVESMEFKHESVVSPNI